MVRGSMSQPPAPREQIFENATVLTFDKAQPVAQALAIRDGTIIAVGDRATVQAAAPSAECIDLQGACMIPGFNDTHAHMEREGLKSLRPSLAAATSVEDIWLSSARPHERRHPANGS
jgi:predicted amidohydrolase YtcJ